ncbi:hypothetical protein QRO11_08110 [Paracidovorax citrulli]|uniref:DUF6644 domain-containing protein n=2 Tax=Paracidovorax citrulli TaxID=80869 RepID=A1TNV0_PARC0|nr:DUF6644 family protein [Paracidovorax citrulli]ABM32638.1 conserved hypothetical protein [Paracidovorax citrulli AAC00-1]ATG93354.1 hypothetical protein CQB05_04270 [Paracidovorax citrulli]MVT27942.1 hypothetical protein [Paracidovorax citrulli]MVT36916.1 hypothetical protein [Paracidovorax citrulli]PVY66855.1 hypothetical protein C8E08_4281 [Paracidovorax citrulli]
MSSAHFIAWLYESALSTTIRDVLWIVPLVQSIHILAIAVLLGAALVSDLRLAGLLATDEPAGDIVRRYVPWMRNALIVLLATGLIMTIGEPDRVLRNMTFWLKMALVVGAFSLTWLVRRPLLHRTAGVPGAPAPSSAWPLAWLSIALWCTVIFFGRWIAYTI